MLVALQWEHHTAAAAGHHGGMITLICMSVSLCLIVRKMHVVPDFHLAAAVQRATSLARCYTRQAEAECAVRLQRVPCQLIVDVNCIASRCYMAALCVAWCIGGGRAVNITHM
jgi:hypothetical protein